MMMMMMTIIVINNLISDSVRDSKVFQRIKTDLSQIQALLHKISKLPQCNAYITGHNITIYFLSCLKSYLHFITHALFMQLTIINKA